MVTEQEELSLAYLLDPAFQLINTNGKPLTGGWIECYIHGTRNKYYCYSDWNGNLHPFQIPLDSLGANIVLAEPSQSYDIYVYNKFGSLVMSRYNVMPGKGGSGSALSMSDSQHWLGQDGPLSENLDPTIEYNILSLPTTPDYNGAFIERIENGNCMYLTAGIYLINCVIDYRQDPTDLRNTIDEVKVYTGNANGDEDQAFILDETGPDSSTDRHCLKLTFIRKVLSQGETSTVDCSNVLFFAPSNDVKWKNARIQTLQIVKLQMPHGAIGTGDYTAGQYVQITDTNVINVTGLQPAGNYATEEYVQEAVSGLENYTEGQYISIHDHVISVTGLEPGSGAVYQEGQYISIDGDTISVTGVQPAGDYVTEAQLNSATSGKLDSSAYVAPVNADWNSTSGLSEILNKPNTEEVQFEELDLSSYATHDEVTSATSGKLDSSAYVAPVNADWSATSGLSQILNKPNTEEVQFEELDLSSYATHDYVDSATSGKMDSSAYVAPVNADWNSTSGLSEILNKPNTEEVQFEELDLSDYATKEYVDSATSGIAHYTEGDHIQITDQNQINVTGIGTLSAGPNVEIYQVGGGYAISAAPGGSSYSEGQYISIDNNEISVTGLQPVSAMSGYVPSSGYRTPVQSDWDEDDNTDLAYIINKPDPIDLIPGSGISITDTSAGVVISCSATGGGSTYTEGQYISIDNNVISVTGLQPSGDYLTSGDVSNFADQGYVDNAIEEATSGLANPVNADWSATSGLAEILNKPSTEEVEFEELDLSNYVQQSDLSGYVEQSDLSDYVQQSDLSGYASKNDLSGKLDTSAYTAPMNADWSATSGLSEILNKPTTEEVQFEELDLSSYVEQSELSAYATHAEVVSATSGLQEELTFSYNSSNEISAINNSAIAAGGGGTTYSEGQYISIDNDTISVTGLEPFEYAVSGISGVSGVFIEDAGDHMNIGLSAQFATLEDIASATSGKLDTSAYTAPVNSDWNATSGLAEILNKPSTEDVSFEELDLSNYVQQNDLSGKLDSSAYVAPVNSDWSATSGLSQILNKPSTEDVTFEELDLSGYVQQNELSAYQTVANMSAYQPTSGMAAYATDNEVAAAVSGKQNKITAFNDSVLVNALPSSPVATTLYLIPEA